MKLYLVSMADMTLLPGKFLYVGITSDDIVVGITSEDIVVGVTSGNFCLSLNPPRCNKEGRKSDDHRFRLMSMECKNVLGFLVSSAAEPTKSRSVPSSSNVRQR